MLIKFTIPLCPITKKNHQEIRRNFRTGKPYISQSEQYRQYETDALWLIPKRGIPIDFPVNVKCLFYVPTKGRCDLVGHLQSIDDILVKAGILADDNYKIIASHDGSRVFVDKENPRTEVEITKILED